MIFSLDNSMFIALGLYVFPLIVWSLIYSSKIDLEYVQIFKNSFLVSVFISCLGVVQFFVSPNLFNLISTDSNSIKWAVNMSFSEYSSFFRASSTLGSPQVFGLYCALIIIISNRFSHELNNKVLTIGYLILGLGGILSGNKTFILIVVGYASLKVLPFFLSKPRVLVKPFFLVSLLLGSVSVLSNYIPMVERVVSLEAVIAQEASVSRFSNYGYIFKNTNILIGNGLGSITNKSHEKLRAAESYILKVYYETGFFGMIGLLVLLGFGITNSFKSSYQDFLIMCCVVCSMIVVHAFESPVFFIIWGYVLFLFNKPKFCRSVHV